MATNKLALLRYHIIDKCLQNRSRSWTLQDLIEHVADELWQNHDISSGISKRTIQSDIQTMRSDTLGYNAPIVVQDKKYYTYQDPNYSISNSPINAADTLKLKEALQILRQLNTTSQSDELHQVIAKLDNKLLLSERDSPLYIHMESNSMLKGLKYIDPIYQSIKNKNAISITYKSFKNQKATENTYHPYLLKEYRNRWFALAYNPKNNQVITLALDRIQNITFPYNIPYIPYQGIDFQAYFKHIIGVSKNPHDKIQTICFSLTAKEAPYLITKPLHSSQEILHQDSRVTTFTIKVIPNIELERELLAFGEALEVISPKKLRNKLCKRILKMVQSYNKQP